MVGTSRWRFRAQEPPLTLAPDYVLKPLLLDHRGIREIAYEAIRILSQNPLAKTTPTFDGRQEEIIGWSIDLEKF
jgi:hypothetical protein